MKNFLFALLLIFVTNIFSYELLSNFLQSGNFTMEYGDELLKNQNWNAINLAVGLTSTDIELAITQLYSQLSEVDGKPTINFSPTVNSSANCRITYAELSDYAIMKCWTYNDGFLIEVNTAIRDNAEWNNLYGLNTHINLRSVLKHELGHALGLADIYNSEFSELLMYGENDKADVVTTIDLTPKIDDINGFKHVYEPPSIQIQNPYVLDGETYKVFYENESDEIEFRVTVPELQEYNSEIPADIIPVGYFTSPLDSYSGLDASFNYIGNRTYSYTTTMKSITDYMEMDTVKLRTFNERASWVYGNYWQNDSPCGEVTFKIAPKPTIESPTTNEIYHVRPSGGKDSVTDTLAIKVRVPQILGSYPDINIKIDDVYVNPGDITFDSEENVWVYNWDLSAETPTQYGEKYSIKAEIDGDPTDYDLSSVYLVEAILFEDFQTIVDFASAGWAVETFIYPPSTPYGWKLGLDLITAETGTRCAKSIYTYSLSFYDMLRTPAITIPSDPNIVTKLTYRLAYKKGSTAVNLSKLYFNIYDQNDNQITFNPALATVASSWIDVEYDLSSYAGQTIKLNWKHHYSSTTIYCENTQFAIDDVKVFQIPDMDSPNIDFIAGNVADLNEDMNLTLQFNDNSGIESVTADYSIEEDSNTITLYPVKGTYNYTGVIPARDHECNGSISYRILDSVGNETVSGGHGIYWALSGGGILSAPENVVITTENDSTIALTWDIVDGAIGYKVFSSLDPYGSFAEDSTGTFTESRKWEKAFDGNKYFYYIIATDGAKEEVFLENNEDESAVLPLSIKQLRSIR